MYADYNANATWFMIYGAVSYLYPGLAFGNIYIPKNPITHTVCLFPSRGWRQMEDIWWWEEQRAREGSKDGQIASTGLESIIISNSHH